MTPLGLRDRFEELGRHAVFGEALAALRDRFAGPQQLTGLTAVARVPFTLLTQRRTGRPVLAVTGTQAQAEDLHDSLRAWLDVAGRSGREAPPTLLPAHDVTPFDGLSPHADISERRGIALWRMAEGQVSIVVAPVAAVLQRVANPGRYRGLAWDVEVGDAVSLDDLVMSFDSLGYARRDTVEMVGQFAVRGGILDAFVPEFENPCRIELLGDQVESIRVFDVDTQRSVRRLDSLNVLPMQEYPAGGSGERMLPPAWEFSAIGPEWRSGSLLDLMPNAVLQFHEPQEVAQEAEALRARLEEAAARVDGRPADYYYEIDEWMAVARGRSQITFDELGLGAPHMDRPDGTWNILSQPGTQFKGDVSTFVDEIRGRIAAGSQALVAAASIADLEQLADMFREYEVPSQIVLPTGESGISRVLAERSRSAGPRASAILVKARIRHGCALPDAHFCVYGTEDIFARTERTPRPRRRTAASTAFLSDLEDLKEGDPVVHAQHGIGRYLGTTAVKTGNRSEDFMLLEYAEGAKLYVPLARLDLVHSYHGAGGPSPQLDRMGGQTWERTKRRVRAQLVDMADELLKIYAQRKLGRDFAYSPDSNWQSEFEDAFPYQLTHDQGVAIREIKEDMESTRIMDRLVCGDVGFGKTEVAMRAAFKALGDDKQVAVLVPTTVLAFQHFETFRQRFEPFPVEIEMLSRFRTPREIREVVAGLRSGHIDIVIGTHRVLSKDIEFSDLGLLVVDEEQRFGVRHKERLKQLRKTVDVLTLTATPIPRTLHMSLTGLRDVSVIKTPPQDRLAVQTVVAEYDDHMVHTAIRREVARKGQVYFLHNRVDSIDEVAGRLANALPGVRIRVGHGQMGERDLERVMLSFMNHECDVLVATTIIENGLDIPLANTIVIDRADLYGVSELYQLRGRVGRSDRRAYAYLFVPKNRQLSEIARRRLAALREFSELGSGFKIAALDLELRGAGNILGAEQSGQLAAVGFETYTQLLEETVRKLQGEDVQETVRSQLSLHLDLHVPDEYIPDESQRLQLYRRLAAVRDDTEGKAVAAELRDRFGPLPDAVRTLLEHALLQHRAEALRIAAVERRGERLRVKFREDSVVAPDKLMRFVSATHGASFTPEGVFEWSGFSYRGRAVLDRVNWLLDRFTA